MPPAHFAARLEARRDLSGGYFVLELSAEGDPSLPDLRETTPGQFVMLRGEWGRDLITPRAFSLLHAPARDRFTVMLKVYGRGTARLRDAAVGDPMEVTAPLGRGFAPARADGPLQLLVAGGVGLPPLHLQARRAAAAGLSHRVELLYGGRDACDLVLTDEVEGWGVPVHLATEDGSRGHHGRVTELLAPRVASAREAGVDVEILSCGPTPMLRAVRALALELGVPAALCLEEQMACGFGACLGCAVPVHGPKPYGYCCTDGPVFDARKVRWS